MNLLETFHPWWENEHTTTQRARIELSGRTFPRARRDCRYHLWMVMAASTSAAVPGNLWKNLVRSASFRALSLFE